MNPYFDVLPSEIFKDEFKNPVTDGSGYMSATTRSFKTSKESGWDLVDGKLIILTKELFAFEILLRSPAFERIVFPFKDNLEKLGIEVEVRTIDSAQYQKMETFDFDMVVQNFSIIIPGNEQEIFGALICRN